MVSLKRKIIRNTIANYINKSLSIVIQLIMLPFIVYHIGAVDYGIYLFVGALTGYFGLLDLGVGVSTVKYTAEHITKKDKFKVNETFNTSFFFFLLIGIIISVSLILIGEHLLGALGLSPDLYWKGRMIIYLTAIGSIFGWCLSTLKHVLGGLQRYEIIALVTIITTLLTTSTTVIVLLMGYGIIEMVFWAVIISTVGWLLTAFFTMKFIPYLEIKTKYLSKIFMKKIFTFSSVVFILDICGIIMIQTDRILIGIFVSIGAVTFYAVAAALHGIIKTSSGLVGSALLPAATELDALNEKEKLHKLILRGGKYKCAMTIPFLVFIIIMAEPIIKVWMGDNYLSVVIIAQVFVSYFFVYAIWGVLGTVLLATEKYKLILRYTIAITITNFIISLILVQKFGVIGVVIGTAIPYIFVLPWILIVALKILDMNLKTYLKEVVLKTYPQAGLVALLLLIGLILWYPATLLMVGLYGLGSVALYFGLFYAFGLDQYERKEFKQYLTFSRK